MEAGESARFDRVRDAASYDQFAPAYNKHIEQLSAPLARRAVALAELKKGQQVLDVGTGSGIAARYAAAAVGPTGRVLGIDLSEGMVGPAMEVARQQGLTNVEFRRMDAESLELPSESFDAVLSLCAPAHFPDLARALAEMSRVLAPRHRLVVAVGSGRPLLGHGLFRYGVWRLFMKLKGLLKTQLWAPHVILDLIGRRVPQVPEPTVTSWSEHKPYERLAGAVTAAGFQQIATHYQGHILTFDSAEAFWEAQEAIVTSARKRLITLPPEQREALRREFLVAAQRTLDRGGRLYYPYGAFSVSGVRAP